MRIPVRGAERGSELEPTAALTARLVDAHAGTHDDAHADAHGEAHADAHGEAHDDAAADAHGVTSRAARVAAPGNAPGRSGSLEINRARVVIPERGAAGPARGRRPTRMPDAPEIEPTGSRIPVAPLPVPRACDHFTRSDLPA